MAAFATTISYTKHAWEDAVADHLPGQATLAFRQTGWRAFVGRSSAVRS
jgi:hypothetical protein